MPGPQLTPELAALEEQLRQLAPCESNVDRDTLLYQAGRASVRRRWLWPVATMGSMLTACALAMVLVLRPAPVVERIVHVPVPVPVNDTPPDSPIVVSEEPPVVYPVVQEDLSPRHRLQEHLLRWGLDGLEPAPPGSPTPVPGRNLYSHYSRLTQGESLP
jgi:hypothetical protein